MANLDACKPPLCGTWRIDVVDCETGSVIHTFNEGSQWRKRFTFRENQTSDFQLTVDTAARCCSLRLVPWRHKFKAYRDGRHCFTWLYTQRIPTIERGERQVLFAGVSPMWLALARVWLTARNVTLETSEAFTLALDEADILDPIGLLRDARPLGQQITIDAAQHEPLVAVWNQLQSGTLEWTEYGTATGEQAVRYGEISYDARLTLSNEWWESPVEPSQNGTLLASVVQVTSTVENEDGTETVINGWYPPLQPNGSIDRGSGRRFIPRVVTVEGLTSQSEADAVARRIWEKSQTPDSIEDNISNTLTRKAAGFCPCDIRPGAILGADLSTECGAFFDQVRMTELTIEIDSGREIAVAPALIAGQA